MSNFGDYFPTGFWRDIGDDVSYRQYKHWATNVWAGEGLKQREGRESRSGCLLDDNLCYQPYAVEARHYRKGESDKKISAVLSFPSGMGFEEDYFWEIYPSDDGDIERFVGEGAEEAMELKVKELLNNE